MSNRAINRALPIQGLNPAAKAILILLANAKNETSGKCYPSIPKLALYSALSESGVKLAIKELEAAGLIRRTFVQKQNRTLYELLFDLDEGEAVSAPQGGQSVTPEGGQSVTPNQKKKPESNLPSSLRSEGPPATAPSGGNVIPLKRKTRLSEDFAPTADDIAYGIAHGLTEQEVRHELEKFLNHFLGTGDSKLDWHRTLKKWLLTASEGLHRPRQAAPGRNGPSPATLFHATQRTLARVQAARGDDGRHEVDLPF